MRGEVLRFTARPAALPLPEARPLPLRTRVEIRLRVARWRWRRAQPRVVCLVVGHVWLEVYSCGMRWCERCGAWESMPATEGRVVPGRRLR